MHYASIDLPDLGPEEVGIGAVVLMKVIKADGSVTYREFKTEHLHYVEALGMAETYTDTCRAFLMRGARPA